MTDLKKDIAWRVYVVYFFICLFALTIVGRALMIQLVEGGELREKVESVTIRERAVDAVRGNIYAADGSLLATSIPIYEVRFDPNTEALTDDIFNQHVDSLAYCLSQLFQEKSYETYRNDLIRARASGSRYHLIRRNVKYTQLKKLKKFPIFRRGKFKGGLIYLQKNKRERPFKLLAQRTIGYERGEDLKVGLEGAYSVFLSGIKGQRLEQKIAGGVWKPIGDESEIEPEDGCDIHTTIDVNLQDVAENALLTQLDKHQADHGCVVLMEVATGKIKAIANLKRSESGAYYEEYNYAIGESTEPGSTFKLPALVAALEDGKVDLDDIIDCEDGSKQYFDRTMFDSNHDDGGSGKITVKRVFEVSSNIGMAEIIQNAYSRDPQKFIKHLDEMSLREPLGIEIAGEGRPLIKSPTDTATEWSGITLAWMAHGYELRQTPLQILTFYNAIANDGVMVKPRFVEKITKGRSLVEEKETEVINPSVCSKSTIKKVKKALEGVVENGTAKNLRNADYKIAGKTGTAQIAKDRKGYRKNAKVNHQASFVGYFPADAPEYSCIVVVNSPSRSVYYGNLVAGPIFKEVADKVYANSLEMHQELDEQRFAANSRIPYSKNGFRSDLQKVFHEMEVPVVSNVEEQEWVVTATKDTLVKIASRKIQHRLVPNVQGMGLQDAIYLLENEGLRVKFEGYGVVRNQSIRPGLKVIEGQEIELEMSS